MKSDITIKEWLEKDPHGFTCESPIRSFYYHSHVYLRHDDAFRTISWTFGSDCEELEDLEVPPCYTILTSDSTWKMISRGTIRRIDFALLQLKRAREIGSRWKKERYYWNAG